MIHNIIQFNDGQIQNRGYLENNAVNKKSEILDYGVIMIHIHIQHHQK